MAEFVDGLELSRRFFGEAVRPVLDHAFPRLKYSAALIGWGSEVLGFDTPRSSDHHWGPRALLFVGEKDFGAARRIGDALAHGLPHEFIGYSTSFGDPEPNGVRVPLKIKDGPVRHMVQVFTVRSFFQARLGVDPYKKLSIADWLTFPQQRLLEIASGAVYHDGLDLEKVRRKFAFYPDDLWLYMLAAQWKKISQEEAFVGRAGEVGDELGSRILAARLVREIVRLCFLMERRYAPYSKWLGSAFAKMKIGRKLSPVLVEALSANDWKRRERAMSKAYGIVARAQNSLGITPPVPTTTSNYFGRPFKVIHADKISEEIRKEIKSPAVRMITADFGAVDQFADSSDLLNDLDACRRLNDIYR